MKMIPIEKLVAVIWILVAATSACSAEMTGFWFNLSMGREPWDLNLPAPIAQKLYKDARTAIKIENVICDGKIIPPEIFPIGGFPDERTVQVGKGVLVYRTLGGNQLSCWVDINKNPGHFELKKFTLPRSFRTLRITYRVRFPDKSVSSPMEANYISSDDVPSIFNTVPARTDLGR